MPKLSGTSVPLSANPGLTPGRPGRDRGFTEKRSAAADLMTGQTLSDHHASALKHCRLTHVSKTESVGAESEKPVEPAAEPPAGVTPVPEKSVAASEGDAWRARIAQLEARVAALEARFGPRDAADVQVIVEI